MFIGLGLRMQPSEVAGTPHTVVNARSADSTSSGAMNLSSASAVAVSSPSDSTSSGTMNLSSASASAVSSGNSTSSGAMLQHSWAGLTPLVDWDMAQAVVTSGTSVDSIPDATGQGRTLTGVSSNKPDKVTASANFNGKDTVSFAGSSQKRFTFGDVGIANNGPFSIVIVAKVNTEDATNKWIMETTNQHIGIYGDVAGHHWHEWLNSGFVGVDMSTAPLITTSTVLLATLSSGTQRFYANSATEKGNHASSGGTFSGGGVIGNNSVPGNGFSLNGEIARIIVFGVLLDSTQRTNILNELGAEYGITIS